MHKKAPTFNVDTGVANGKAAASSVDARSNTPEETSLPPERGVSPNMKKRPSGKSSEESPSKKNKLKEPEAGPATPRFPSPPHVPAAAFDEKTWQGWCEIESDPAYFSVILREIGIEGVDVQELHFLDPDHLATMPTIHGLVLLFRHREFDQQQEEECPENVWFANQMPGQNSCATLAMIHTLINNNDLDIDIGEHMRQFKDFTKNMTPLQRGQTFTSWNYVKKIHNSFAKKMDILENDMALKQKVLRSEEKKAAGKNLKPKPKSKSNSRFKTERRASDESIATQSSTESFEDSAHHYISFVPIDGEVWKLDGLDAQPTFMGAYEEEEGEPWFNTVSNRINALIATGDNDYSIFAITLSPLVPLRNQLCEVDATTKYVDAHLNTLHPEWKEFLDQDDREPPSPCFMGTFSEEQRAANPIPDDVKEAIEQEEDITELLDRHKELVGEMRRLVSEYTERYQEVVEQDERAEARRWDYGPAIQLWLFYLARSGWLEKNMHKFPKK